MFQQLISILAFSLVALAAFGVGRPVLRGLGVGQEDRLSAGVWSIALGLIVAAMFLMGLGLLGGLYAPAIGAMTAAAACWGAIELRRGCFGPHGGTEGGQSHFCGLLPQESGQSPASDTGEPAPPAWPTSPWWLLAGVGMAAAAAAIGSLVGALAPPTAGDALCYHLQLPKVFLAEHGFADLPYDENATFPLTAEMWFLWGLALDGGVSAQLVHWGLGVLLTLATVVLATPILGRPWAWIAGGVVLLTPGVNNQMTAPLNDVALAAFTTLSLAAWYRAAVDEDDGRWFVVAGMAAGAALGTKYIAGLFALAVAATWLWAMARHPQHRWRLLRGAAVVAVVAASIGGPWYLRAAWHRGNPLYPFLGEVFSAEARGGQSPFRGQGRENWDSPREGLPATLPASKSPLGRGLAAMAAAPWHVTMHPERFGGRGHQLGVLLAASAAGLLFCRRLRGLGTLLAVTAVYCVVWFLLRQNVRFLFPAAPLLAVATVWVWIEMGRFPRAPRWMAAAVYVLVVVAMAAAPLRRAREQVGVATGLVSRSDYLAEHEPTWPAAVVANAELPRDAHILSQDYRAFYFDRRTTRESIYRRRTHYDRQIGDPGEFGRTLRRAGFTHLLVAESVGGDGAAFDPTLRRLAERQWATDAAGQLRVLADYRFHDCSGAVRRYRLVALEQESAEQTPRRERPLHDLVDGAE